MVVDELLDALRDAAEEFFAIEDGGEFAADLVEHGKRGGLLRVGHEQARRDGIGVADHWKWKAFRLVIHISQLFSRKLDYSMLKEDVTFRKEVAEKVGIGFELPRL